MKKSTIIIGIALTVVSLTAYGFINLQKRTEKIQIKAPTNTKVVLQNDFMSLVAKKEIPDFIYDVDHRFIATVTKEKLTQAKTIIDILPAEATQSLKDYNWVNVSVLNDDQEIREIGVSEVLNAAQVELLQSIDYSTNFFIKANCKRVDDYTNATRNYQLIYYITTVPEKEAQYKGGKSAMINYLKENSKKEVANTTKDQLKSGKVSFIVTNEGTISGTQLESTSGYPSVDEKMLELIQNLPGEWEPANNARGEKVAQKLFFSFGTMGC